MARDLKFATKGRLPYIARALFVAASGAGLLNSCDYAVNISGNIYSRNNGGNDSTLVYKSADGKSRIIVDQMVIATASVNEVVYAAQQEVNFSEDSESVKTTLSDKCNYMIVNSISGDVGNLTLEQVVARRIKFIPVSSDSPRACIDALTLST